MSHRIDVSLFSLSPLFFFCFAILMLKHNEYTYQFGFFTHSMTQKENDWMKYSCVWVNVCVSWSVCVCLEILHELSNEFTIWKHHFYSLCCESGKYCATLFFGYVYMKKKFLLYRKETITHDYNTPNVTRQIFFEL